MECGLSLVVLVVVVVVCKLNLTILLVRVYLSLGHFHSAGEHILSHIKCNATFLCQKIVVINRVWGVVVGRYDFPVFRRLLISTFGIKYVCKKRDNT